MQLTKKANCKLHLDEEIKISEDSANVCKTHNYQEADQVEQMKHENERNMNSEDRFFQKLKVAAQTVKWKAAHKKLDFEGSLAETTRQNDHLTAWHSSGERLNNLWMFINGEQLFQAPLPQVSISAMPEAAEGTRLEFWHCDENNQKDFLLFIYKIERKDIRGVIQDLTPTQTLGINVRYCSENNRYFVIWRVGQRDKTAREVNCQMKADREILDRSVHSKAIAAGDSFLKLAGNWVSDASKKISGGTASVLKTYMTPHLTQLSTLVGLSVLLLSVLVFSWLETSGESFNIPHIIDQQYIVADSGMFSVSVKIPESKKR